MDVRSRLLVFRAEIVLRRANRRRRRQLEAELATYTTQSDVDDLYGLLDTYPDNQTQEIRDILAEQRMRRAWTIGGMR